MAYTEVVQYWLKYSSQPKILVRLKGEPIKREINMSSNDAVS
jgi:hypothetical protein